MKINQIVQETTTSGSVAPVEHSFVKMQTRSPSVYGNTKAGSLFKGKKTNKPYGNSLNEGAMNQLSLDLKGGPDGLSDVEFQKKYKMSKQEARKELSANRQQNKKFQPVSEAELAEDDIILVPGQGRKMKTGFVPHGKSRVDHEVEMARSDVLATMKNAKAIYELLKNRSEEEGLEGWVQEKLIKANDYLNAVKEYYDEKMMQQESLPPAGVIGNGSMGEGKIDFAKKIQKNIDNSNKAVVKTKREIGSRIADIGPGGKEYNVKTDKAWDDAHKVKEGAKVDRMVKHITKSEKKLGKSKDEAENIAWATANKRGMLDNKNKKAK
jgi:hypothetical protein